MIPGPGAARRNETSDVTRRSGEETGGSATSSQVIQGKRVMEIGHEMTHVTLSQVLHAGARPGRGVRRAAAMRYGGA